jgi:hypothetical protein
MSRFAPRLSFETGDPRLARVFRVKYAPGVAQSPGNLFLAILALQTSASNATFRVA